MTDTIAPSGSSVPEPNAAGPNPGDMSAFATVSTSSRPRATRVVTPPPNYPKRMGYQPSLDGLRALSVIVVLFYHGGFSWMHGGFFGVEVFFVVSGFLITSLLLEEHDRNGRIAFGGFWLRRAKRLLPAFFAVILFVAVWAALAGSAEQRSQLRRDIPWSIFYVSNWGQILGDVPYFSGDPPLLRHLWSLAVEEQWYLIWPLVFVGIMALRKSHRTIGIALGVAALLVFVLMFWLHSGSPTPLGGPPSLFEGLNRTNFLYLSTITRAGGLLLGAGAAFWWRPWRWPNATDAPVAKHLDVIGAVALTILACAAAVAEVTAGYVYQWLLPLVSILSLVAIMVAVHPASVGIRRILSWPPLVEIGKRSYGLYLWSWPIFVIFGATEGAVGPFVLAMAITIAVTEVSYRFLETPVRTGEFMAWWRERPSTTNAPLIGGAMLVGCLVVFYISVTPFNRFEGGSEATFALDEAATADPSLSSDDELLTTDGSGSVESGATDGSGSVLLPIAPDLGEEAGGAAGDAVPESTAVVASTTVLPATTATVAIVGDSQANALAINLPDGIETVFPDVVNGSVDGCSVYDSGSVDSSVSFSNNFAMCDGWQDDWASAAAGQDVALVVVGAWDVFDVEGGDGTVYGFATPEADELWMTNLRSGIDAMLATGADVGLLEIACMRPVNVEGAGVPALPERGDDARIAHLNELLVEVADGYGDEVSVIDGPDEWCNDEAIATDLGYRWDGVHVYKPGANLIYTKIAPQLLQLAAA